MPDAASVSLPLAQPDPGQLRVGEQAERHLPPGGHAILAGEVGQHHAEVVLADVREVRAASAVPGRPDALGSRPEPLVNLDVPPLVRLDPRELQSDAVGVRRASPGNEEVRPFDRTPPRVQTDGFPGFPVNAIDGDPGQDLDPLVSEEPLDRLGDVRVLAVDQARSVRRPSRGCRSGGRPVPLEAHVAAAEDDQVPREVIQLQGLDVGQRANLREAGGVVAPARTGVDHDGLAAERPGPARVQRHLEVVGATGRPCPMTSSAPLSRYFSRCSATSPSTIFRLRSRTAAMSTFQSPLEIPNSEPRRK